MTVADWTIPIDPAMDDESKQAIWAHNDRVEGCKKLTKNLNKQAKRIIDDLLEVCDEDETTPWQADDTTWRGDAVEENQHDKEWRDIEKLREFLDKEIIACWHVYEAYLSDLDDLKGEV